MATIKLQTNIPVVGVVKYLDYYPSKMVDGQEYSAQVALKGTWDGMGEGVIYLPHFLANDIIGAGLAQSNGEKAFQGQQVPQFKWLYAGRVQVLKAEEGRTKRTSVLPLDNQPVQPVAAPIIPQAAAPVAPNHAAPISSRVAAPSTDDGWNSLERQYGRAHAIACKVWGGNYEPQALVAAAATLFIEANKRGLNPASSYDAMPGALAREEDPMPWER